MNTDYTKNPLTVTSAPHLKNPERTSTIMLDVIIALLPAAAWGVYVFGWRALAIVLASVISAVLFEAVYQFFMNVPITVKDGSAAVTGLLIPPSNVILIYALASGTSVAGLFLAGILPGILFGVLLMIAAMICCRWCGFGERSHAPFSFVLLWKTFWGAFPGLSLAVIVMLGIVKGWVTATEAAAIAAAYALFLSMFVYKRVKVKDLPKILVEAGILISVVLFLIATSTAMCWLISLCHIPEYVSSCLINMFDSPFLVLLMINILLLLVGAFTDLTPVIVIFTPILLPVVQKFGMHPIQFGIVMVANLSIGLCTPPVGTSLFVSCALAKSSIGETSKYMVIFVIFMLIGLLLITHFPWFTMCLQ